MSDRSHPFAPPARLPHPATFVQAKAAIWAPAGRPPHPATVVQAKSNSALSAPAARQPHPALVAQNKPAFSTTAAKTPHSATVVQAKTPWRGTTLVQTRARHPAVAQASGLVTALTATTLNVGFVSAFTEKLGQFTFEVSFAVTPAGTGYIVQHVKRVASIYKRRGRSSALLSDTEIDTWSSENPNYASWMEYWEVFEVEPSTGKSIDNDQFSFSQMDLANHPKHSTSHTTDGTFTVTGTATFYPGKPPSGVFNAGDTSNPANGLPWTTTDPSPRLPAGGSNSLEHSAMITWIGQKKGGTRLVCTIDGKSVYDHTI